MTVIELLSKIKYINRLLTLGVVQFNQDDIERYGTIDRNLIGPGE